MENKDKALDILSKIESGDILVKWKDWFFSGGRTYGNGDIYSLSLPDKTPYGELTLNDCTGLDIRDSEDNVICYEVNDEDVTERADEVLYHAIQRDDKKLVNLLSRDGVFLGLPRDYCDISRDDVFKGRRSVEQAY